MAMTKAIAEASNNKSGKPNNKKIAPPVKKANVVREQNAKTPTMIEPHIIIGFLWNLFPRAIKTIPPGIGVRNKANINKYISEPITKYYRLAQEINNSWRQPRNTIKIIFDSYMHTLA